MYRTGFRNQVTPHPTTVKTQAWVRHQYSQPSRRHDHDTPSCYAEQERRLSQENLKIHQIIAWKSQHRAKDEFACKTKSAVAVAVAKFYLATG
jgi:hypothetical protein